MVVVDDTSAFPFRNLQVKILLLRFFQAVVDRRLALLVAQILGCHFGREEELRSRDAGFIDGLTAGPLIGVHDRRVNLPSQSLGLKTHSNGQTATYMSVADIESLQSDFFGNICGTAFIFSVRLTH
jgi:hypothetical protein